MSLLRGSGIEVTNNLFDLCFHFTADYALYEPNNFYCKLSHASLSSELKNCENCVSIYSKNSSMKL